MDNYEEQKAKLTQKRDFFEKKLRTLEGQIEKEQEELLVLDTHNTQVSNLEEVW